jgi:hypothetical protein
VAEALSDGVQDLASVTRRVLQHVQEPERYRGIGRVAAIVARLRTPLSTLERPWVPVTDIVEIENWSLNRTAEGKGK